MSKKKDIIDSFKILLNVKKGGSEFFRLVIKISVWIFGLGAVLYGFVLAPQELISVQKQNFNLEVQKSNIELVKLQRICDFSAKNELSAAVAVSKKNGEELTDKQKQSTYNNNYTTCLYLQGLYTPDSKAQK